MEIVSGRTGKPHVTSEQFRQFIGGTVGWESCILDSGENMEPELASNNLLKIRSGMMAHHGNISSVKLGTYDEVELTNGSQGMKRIDLVVNRYTRNAETEVEANEWVVVIGTPDADSPVAPSYTIGNLQDGDLVDDCPVFEVHYDGINITEVKKLLSVNQTNKGLTDKVGNLGQSAAIGQYGAQWNVTTTYKNVGSSLAIVNNDLYETVSGNDAVLKIKKPGTYLLIVSSEFAVNTSSAGGTVWSTIFDGAGAQVARGTAYLYGNPVTVKYTHMLKVESAVELSLRASCAGASAGAIRSNGADLLQCIKIL